MRCARPCMAICNCAATCRRPVRRLCWRGIWRRWSSLRKCCATLTMPRGMLELQRAFTLEGFHRLLLRGLEGASLPGYFSRTEAA